MCNQNHKSITFSYGAGDIRGHSITTWTSWGGGQKMSVFVHAQGIKTVQVGGVGKNGKILST